jgi:hypothetical protein
MNFNVFHGKSNVEKLDEEKVKLELDKIRLERARLNNPKPIIKSNRMRDESTEDYLRKLQNARRTGKC